MSVTLQDCRDLGYALLRESESDSSSYPVVLMDALINAWQLSICSWTLVNPNPKIAALSIVKKGVLPFLRKNKFYKTVQAMTLSEDATEWWTTLTLWNSENYPSTWTVFINWNPITYTGNTNTWFAWCSGIEFPHKAGSLVHFAYSLPTDYMNTVQLIYNSTIKLPAQQYDEIHETAKGDSWYNIGVATWSWMNRYNTNPFYSIIDNKYLVIFNIQTNSQPLLLRYEKKPTVMAVSTDTLTIDNDEFSKLAILYLQIWEMLYNRWEENRWAELINQGMARAKKLYTYYNNQAYEDINGSRVQSDKSWRIINI